MEAEAVEEAIGGRIAITAMSQEIGRELGRDDLVAITCGITAGRGFATVHVPTKRALDVRTLGHEVMHAHRDLVDNVWKLEGIFGSRIASSIDNDLEHLVIIHREIEMFVGAEVAWAADFRQNISGLARQSVRTDLNEGDTLALRFNLLKAWLVTSLLMPRLPELDTLAGEIDRRGWRRDASNIVAAYGRNASDKQASAAMMIRFARLSPDRFGLMRFLPRAGEVERKVLPTR